MGTGDGQAAAADDPWSGDPPDTLALVVLMVVAGGLDATAFLHLGGAFLSNQTGNVLLLGISVTRDSTIDTGASAAALAGFIVGAAGLGRWRQARRARGRTLRPALVMGVEGVVIGAVALVQGVAQVPAALLTAPLALAMGLQAALARRLGVSYLTGGYVTGSTTTSAMRSPLGDDTDHWWWHGAVPLLAVVGGAAAAAGLSRVSVAGTLALLALGTVAAAALTHLRAGAAPPV
ncbi:YoaK family protein [Iamia majanohamensis]|uniref:YoaK family protein n=1 Tax=Iamia majanohamensis TaxID=467976 RepID=A0AAE9YAF0_9ACTN|nr:YoaK family protein [Iamia majanohamensis]WCO68806.1 YoaK family protein [Iamia majanohamensis]